MINMKVLNIHSFWLLVLLSQGRADPDDVQSSNTNELRRNYQNYPAPSMPSSPTGYGSYAQQPYPPPVAPPVPALYSPFPAPVQSYPSPPGAVPQSQYAKKPVSPYDSKRYQQQSKPNPLKQQYGKAPPPSPLHPHGQKPPHAGPNSEQTVTKITFTTAPAPQTYIRVPASYAEKLLRGNQASAAEPTPSASPYGSQPLDADQSQSPWQPTQSNEISPSMKSNTNSTYAPALTSPTTSWQPAESATQFQYDFSQSINPQTHPGEQGQQPTVPTHINPATQSTLSPSPTSYPTDYAKPSAAQQRPTKYRPRPESYGTNSLSSRTSTNQGSVHSSASRGQSQSPLPSTSYSVPHPPAPRPTENSHKPGPGSQLHTAPVSQPTAAPTPIPTPTTHSVITEAKPTNSYAPRPHSYLYSAKPAASSVHGAQGQGAVRPQTSYSHPAPTPTRPGPTVSAPALQQSGTSAPAESTQYSPRPQSYFPTSNPGETVSVYPTQGPAPTSSPSQAEHKPPSYKFPSTSYSISAPPGSGSGSGVAYASISQSYSAPAPKPKPISVQSETSQYSSRPQSHFTISAQGKPSSAYPTQGPTPSSSPSAAEHVSYKFPPTSYSVSAPSGPGSGSESAAYPPRPQSSSAPAAISAQSETSQYSSRPQSYSATSAHEESSSAYPTQGPIPTSNPSGTGPVSYKFPSTSYSITAPPGSGSGSNAPRPQYYAAPAAQSVQPAPEATHYSYRPQSHSAPASGPPATSVQPESTHYSNRPGSYSATSAHQGETISQYPSPGQESPPYKFPPTSYSISAPSGSGSSAYAPGAQSYSAPASAISAQSGSTQYSSRPESYSGSGSFAQQETSPGNPSEGSSSFSGSESGVSYEPSSYSFPTQQQHESTVNTAPGQGLESKPAQSPQSPYSSDSYSPKHLYRDVEIYSGDNQKQPHSGYPPQSEPVSHQYQHQSQSPALQSTVYSVPKSTFTAPLRESYPYPSSAPAPTSARPTPPAPSPTNPTYPPQSSYSTKFVLQDATHFASQGAGHSGFRTESESARQPESHQLQAYRVPSTSYSIIAPQGAGDVPPTSAYTPTAHSYASPSAGVGAPNLPQPPSYTNVPYQATPAVGHSSSSSQSSSAQPVAPSSYDAYPAPTFSPPPGEATSHVPGSESSQSNSFFGTSPGEAPAPGPATPQSSYSSSYGGQQPGLSASRYGGYPPQSQGGGGGSSFNQNEGGSNSLSATSESEYDPPGAPSYDPSPSLPSSFGGTPSQGGQTSGTQTQTEAEATPTSPTASPSYPQSNSVGMSPHNSYISSHSPSQSSGVYPLNPVDTQSYSINPHPHSNAKVLSYHQQSDGFGHDSHHFDTSNGIQVQEQTELLRSESEYSKGEMNNNNYPNFEESQSFNSGKSIVKKGSFSWVAPDGKKYEVRYVADETGFHPEGDHLPKAPSATFSSQQSPYVK